MIAFLFPGQGAEVPRMGLELAQVSAPAARLLAHASAVCGVDLLRLLERGGPELSRTEVLQPALVAASLGALGELTRAGVRADFVAGHSLGELSAWSAAGVWSSEAAIELAAVRGQLMAREASRSPGGMLSVEVDDEAALEPIFAIGRAKGALELAAHNAPDDWLLSGDRPALTAVAQRWPTKKILAHGAWHSQAMGPAVGEVRAAVRARVEGPARVKLIANRDGQPVDAATDPATTLAEQLVRPVRWVATLATLARAGVTDLVTVGPGKVLRVLARWNLGTAVKVHGTEDAAELARTVEVLKA